MDILANHCHLMPPDSWRPGSREMLLRHLDALGIARAVVFAPFAVQMGGDLQRANSWLLEQVQDEPRLIPFATINPVHPDAIRVLEDMHQAGARGCKIHPSIDVFDLLDPRALAFYAQAAALGMLLDFHTGVHNSPLVLCDPVKFDTILWQIPTLRVILEHAGGRAFFETVLAVAGNHAGPAPHAFLGITTVLERDNFFWRLGEERVLSLLQGLGARQLVFGLDFPWHSLEENQFALQTLLEVPVSDEEKRLLLGGTLSGLLQPC